MKVDEKLDRIFMAGGRGSGRTYTAVQGALATGATLVTHSHQFAKQLKQKHPRLKAIALDPDKLLGHHSAIIVDHHVYETLFRELQEENRLARMIARLIKELIAEGRL